MAKRYVACSLKRHKWSPIRLNFIIPKFQEHVTERLGARAHYPKFYSCQTIIGGSADDEAFVLVGHNICSAPETSTFRGTPVLR